ncbi:hypothetical protein J2I47_04945 [Fibrella sp. HMF5335]|uniref:DUF3826 domain-containing protein n=1 Tax=Fibrella rubiginis TaxID=2817060 RepID=A0A939K3R0_9BACT|nr:hypothetical protein [Fibrella rubiginis]MBO0935888.1 hypothetical protein [Fibrella rubiginis]
MARPYLRSFLLLTAATLWLAARPLDILADLDITPDELHQITLNNLTDTAFHLPPISYKARDMARQLAVGARVEAVKALGNVVRAYTETADFRSRYDAYLRNEYHVSDGQTQAAEQIANTSSDAPKQQFNQAMTQVNQSLAGMDPAMLAMVLQSQIQVTADEVAQSEGDTRAENMAKLTQLKKLQALSRSNPAEFKKQYLAFMNHDLGKAGAGQLKEHEARLADDKKKAADYQQRLADYKAHASPTIGLKNKLRGFIALAESVDFGAKVITTNGRAEFVDVANRRKSNEWKLLYRMGREPVMAARAVAQRWVQDLDRTASR